ncbi:hypothetical protein Nepgr_021840 [Nepenthes gracilis]|uniref:Bifunctional inhibitor/plant lipid transfer protein/seed storage helical domain-containing protein n=1 Tax=Nepenthes gracilis TaxID=150966 RepID=A0AAD3SZW5_NEPGR|nr:hypothetical protein Nepgr_021840 [Nepenthes gracilis]
MIVTASSFSLFTLLLASITDFSSARPQHPPERAGCAVNLLSFSPCLPYVSAPPNYALSSPPSSCCEVYSATIDEGGHAASCLSYLLREPSMLGIPIDVPRLRSLSLICPRNRMHQNSTKRDSSLESGCGSDLKELSPRQSTGCGFLNHSNAVAPTSPPEVRLKPKSPDSPPPPRPPQDLSKGLPPLSSLSKSLSKQSWFTYKGMIFIFVLASAIQI